MTQDTVGREELRRSLANPYPERALAELGLQEWAESVPDKDVEALVDVNAGTPVQWISGEGWLEVPCGVAKSLSTAHDYL
jgi:hypothetical protein